MLGFDALGRLALGQIPKSASIVLPATAGSYVVSGTVAFKVSEAAGAGSYSLAGVSQGFVGSLIPAAGACAVTGVAASFAVSEALASENFALTGVSATFTELWVLSGSSYALTGNAVPDVVSETPASGSYVITADTRLVAFSEVLGAGALGQITRSVLSSNTTTFPINGPAAAGSIAITFGNNLVIRTGGDFDEVYGGVGHYLEEIERLRQLAKITRNTPAPIVHEIRPRLRPLASPPAQPQPPAIGMHAVAAQRMAEQQAQQAAARKRRRQQIEILLLAS
jgi:hypothetical protein